jgi:hypothetical protein
MDALCASSATDVRPNGVIDQSWTQEQHVERVQQRRAIAVGAPAEEAVGP